MKFKRPQLSNLIFIIVIVLLVIPQTRQPIQVFLHKGLAMFSPSTVSESNRTKIRDYNWELQVLNGASYNFEDAKGKVVMINLWATWCPPCIAEMPAIQKLYEDYNDKMEILLVSDEEIGVIQKFLDKHNYTFAVYRSNSHIPEQLSSRSIPRTFIISKKGEIVIDKSGAANWNSEKVRKTLDALIAE